MSRKVRRVPANWEHPVRDGRAIPLNDTFPYTDEEIQEGLADGWLKNEPPHYGLDLMPNWPESERTHYQMYETTTEGTPISPVFESPEQLAHWLADHNAPAFADQGASYEAWLDMITGSGWAPSAAIFCGGIVSGVEAFHERGSHQDK